MYIIRKTRSASGAYPPLQTWSLSTAPLGYLIYPDEFYSTFYPSDKLVAGFVDLMLDKDTITNVKWNDAAYQSYIEALPPEPEPELESEYVTYDELAEAYREGVESIG